MEIPEAISSLCVVTWLAKLAKIGYYIHSILRWGISGWYLCVYKSKTFSGHSTLGMQQSKPRVGKYKTQIFMELTRKPVFVRKKGKFG